MPCGILHVLTPIDIFGTNTTMELKAVCPKVRLILDGSIPMNLLMPFTEASVSAQAQNIMKAPSRIELHNKQKRSVRHHPNKTCRHEMVCGGEVGGGHFDPTFLCLAHAHL